MKKIVVKISSNLLDPDNSSDIIEDKCAEIAELIKNGDKVIIVTSGAVMHGMKILKYDNRPQELPVLQSLAAIGQIRLMARYEKAFAGHGLLCAQILLSADDFRIRKRYLNLRNTIESLLQQGVIPVFNENDTITTEELKFGDNDQLSALISTIVNFDMLVILTDVDGLYDKDPKEHDDAKLICSIDDLCEEHIELGSTKVSKFSSGGMKTKLESALKATFAGIDVFIGNGFKTALRNIMDMKEKGTYIRGKKGSASARKKWLSLSPAVQGAVIIDDGAFKAIKNNSSLLPIGVVSLQGSFSKGSLINVICNRKKIAQGLTNYSSKEIDLIKGKRSVELSKYIKNAFYNEIIHKNNLVLL